MLLKKFVLGLLGSCLLSASYSQDIITGEEAEKRVPHASLLRYKSSTSLAPNYVLFGDDSQYEASVKIMNEVFQINSPNSFEIIKKETDRLGMEHIVLQHNFNGIPVQYSQYRLHCKNNKVVSCNGDLYQFPNISIIPSIDKNAAILSAKQFVNADIYKWEVESEENFIKWRKKDDLATYFPQPELVIAPANGNYKNGDFRLCWKMEIYAHQPMSKQTIYVDANSGEVIWVEEEICHSDTPAPGLTAYSGVRQITTDSFGGGYRLREAGRGNGVETFNLNNGTNYGSATDFVDSDNVWNTFSPASDQYAIDAHWGAEMTYDYYLIKHARNSIDGAGFALLNFVHYDVGYANAFWNGSEMTFGDGGGSITPLTTVDIVGHEITHGLTENTAGLIYQDESGALNESFSDIFGVTIDHTSRGVVGDTLWRIGEQCFPPNGIRQMANPSEFGDPDTYGGTGWVLPGGADNGGVHTNSGVQNFWYYLMCEGGSGTNDLAHAYNVTGIGMDTASFITFRNLTVYLSPGSDFSDARFYSIVSAQDLYGDCSPAVETTTNAWYAVGVGNPYSDGIVAAFTPSALNICTPPKTVVFTNQTLSGSATTIYHWDFGDGNTSGAASPSHTYANNGTYNVSLIADAGGCGIDTIAYTNLININIPDPPVTQNYCTTQNPVTANLTATGVGTVYWYNTLAATVPFFTGTSYTTPSLINNTTYYVEDRIPNGTQHAPPFTNVFGTGNYFNSPYSEYLEFTVYQPITLVSVRTYSGSSGNRTIELWNGGGTLINSLVADIPTGESVVTLNWDLQPGNYRIGGTHMNLWKNGSGCTYPYTLPSLLSITGSSDGTLRYFYFYDWEVASSCISQRIPVIVNLHAPTANFTYNIVGTTVNFTNTSINGNSYWWDFGGGNTSTVTNPSHDYNWGGSHMATLVAINNGCYDTMWVDLTIIGIEDNTEVKGNIYPVPFNDHLRLDLSLSGSGKELQIGLFDVLGSKVSDIYNGDATSTGFSYTWQVPPTLRSGLYLVKVNYGRKELVKRVIKL